MVVTVSLSSTSVFLSSSVVEELSAEWFGDIMCWGFLQETNRFSFLRQFSRYGKF